MNLSKKKALASRALKVGKERIVFVKSRIDEIKEAITKYDMRELKKDGAILIKAIKGRKKKMKKTNRSQGNLRKRVKQRKKKYMIMVRKLRNYVAEIKKQGRISKEVFAEIRKKIRNKMFRSKKHLKDYIEGLEK